MDVHSRHAHKIESRAGKERKDWMWKDSTSNGRGLDEDPTATGQEPIIAMPAFHSRTFRTSGFLRATSESYRDSRGDTHTRVESGQVLLLHHSFPPSDLPSKC